MNVQEYNIRHAVLVEAAAKWLRRTCAVVLTELGTTGEEPDAIGWHGTNSTLIECKTSLADFRADQQKFCRRNPEMGIGQHRYYMTPPGLLAPDLLPPKWGLLEVGYKVLTVRAAYCFGEINLRHELGLLLSTLRRIGQTAQKGVSVRCYTIESKNMATVGIEPESVQVERGEL